MWSGSGVERERCDGAERAASVAERAPLKGVKRRTNLDDFGGTLAETMPGRHRGRSGPTISTRLGVPCRWTDFYSTPSAERRLSATNAEAWLPGASALRVGARSHRGKARRDGCRLRGSQALSVAGVGGQNWGMGGKHRDGGAKRERGPRAQYWRLVGSSRRTHTSGASASPTPCDLRPPFRDVAAQT